MGLWYSPFLLETSGVKEPPDAGSIPAPATKWTELESTRNAREIAPFVLADSSYTSHLQADTYPIAVRSTRLLL